MDANVDPSLSELERKCNRILVSAAKASLPYTGIEGSPEFRSSGGQANQFERE
jgi:hypothetical protein